MSDQAAASVTAYLTGAATDGGLPDPTALRAFLDAEAALGPDTLRSRVENVADSLASLARLRDPLSILEHWNVPEAERQGYLSGLAAAERMLRRALGPHPADGVMEDTAAIGDFMRLLGQKVRDVPTVDITDSERVLRARLVLEEALEFVAAMGCEVTAGQVVVDKSNVSVEIDPAKEVDLVEATDALGDITVVTKGSAHTLGVPIDAAFWIINETNNAKVGGPVRADGKGGKPEGWVPPTARLRQLLIEHGADL